MMKRFIAISILALVGAFLAFSNEPESRELMQQKTSIEAAVDSDCISVSNQTVTITNNSSSPCVYSIYCVTGPALKTIRLGAGAHASFDLPKGFYVVKCNNEWSRKIIVR